VAALFFSWHKGLVMLRSAHANTFSKIWALTIQIQNQESALEKSGQLYLKINPKNPSFSKGSKNL